MKSLTEVLDRLKKLSLSGHHLSIRIKRHAHVGASDGDTEYTQIEEVIDLRDLNVIIKELEQEVKRQEWAYGCGPGTLAGNEDI